MFFRRIHDSSLGFDQEICEYNKLRMYKTKVSMCTHGILIHTYYMAQRDWTGNAF